MKSLIVEAQQEQQKPKGIEPDYFRAAWQKIGSPTSPEAVYDMMKKIMKDEKKVLDAFKAIGIKFEDVGDKFATAKVLDKNVATQILNTTSRLSPDSIRKLITFVSSK